jgi:hypothetical protein
MPMLLQNVPNGLLLNEGHKGGTASLSVDWAYASLMQRYERCKMQRYERC